jgi:hypothetical protein
LTYAILFRNFATLHPLPHHQTPCHSTLSIYPSHNPASTILKVCDASHIPAEMAVICYDSEYAFHKQQVYKRQEEKQTSHSKHSTVPTIKLLAQACTVTNLENLVHLPRSQRDLWAKEDESQTILCRRLSNIWKKHWYRWGRVVMRHLHLRL